MSHQENNEQYTKPMIVEVGEISSFINQNGADFSNPDGIISVDGKPAQIYDPVSP